MRRLLLVSVFLCLAASWAQAQSGGSGSPLTPEASPGSEATLAQLDSLLDELEKTATDLSASSERLRASLLRANELLELLSSRLKGSETLAKELSFSLKESVDALRTTSSSLEALNLEGWIWKGLTVAAAGYAIIVTIPRR